MNDFTKQDLICGSTIVPEFYCQFVDVPLTKKEKIKQFISKIIGIVIETVWFVILMIGVFLMISSFSYLAGIFFKMGVA
jgi:hypothetical protein